MRTYLFSVLTLILLSQQGHAVSAPMPDDCGQVLALNSSSSRSYVFAKSSVVYSRGRRSARQFLRLTSDEYKKRAAEDSIPSDTILLLDSLPLEVDLPLVAGVITSLPLSLNGSHPQLLAEKMGIPMVYVRGAFNDPRLVSVDSLSRFATLSAQKSVRLQITKSPPIEYLESPFKSVLPADSNRSEKRLISLSEVKDFPVEQVGSKFGPLSELTDINIGPNAVRFFGLSPGYYETFLDVATYDGDVLRTVVNRQLEVALNTNDQEKVKIALNKIRMAIEEAHIPKFFDELSLDLLKRNFLPKRPVSVRTNNETEDYIGSGVFMSAISLSLKPENLSVAIRSVWASVFTYRAFAIRRRWGLVEKNISMPLLVHPYIDGEVAHGTGQFQFEDHGLRLKINLVYGSQGKATNPDSQARVSTFEISDEIEIVDPPLNLSPKVEEALLQMYRQLQSTVTHDFIYRSFPPVSVDIEFLVSSDNKPIVLQYKRRQSQETILSLLKGETTLQAVERGLVPAASSTDQGIQDGLNKNAMFTLSDVDFKVGFDWSDNVRFGIIKYNNQYRLVTWKVRSHEQAVIQLQAISGRIQWVYGGYVYLDETQNLVFLPSYAKYYQKISGVKNDFLQALKSEQNANNQTFKNVNNLVLKDVAHQYEESIQIPRPKIPPK